MCDSVNTVVEMPCDCDELLFVSCLNLRLEEFVRQSSACEHEVQRSMSGSRFVLIRLLDQIGQRCSEASMLGLSSDRRGAVFVLAIQQDA